MDPSGLAHGTCHVHTSGLLLLELGLDPVVRYPEAVSQLRLWRPAQLLHYQRVVRVAPTHALRSRDMVNGQLAPAEGAHQLGHVVHGHHLIRA
eukprot:scaffold179_cov368-Prasinococcus_capsulatus_cf.AAC.26